MNYSRTHTNTKQAFATDRFYAVECFTPRRLSVSKLIAMAVVLMVALFSAQYAKAQDRGEWQTHQYVLAGTALALHAIDWAQTRQISDTHMPNYSGPKYVEKAPITRAVIGETPKHSHVDGYMLATAALFLGAAHYLPEYRTAILGTWTASRLFVVINNREVGLRIGGSF